MSNIIVASLIQYVQGHTCIFSPHPHWDLQVLINDLRAGELKDAVPQQDSLV